jgi:molybdenum cofactor synthesis domain-containing protein
MEGTRAAVLTVSDGVNAGARKDESGQVLEERLRSAGFDVVRRVVADEATDIETAIHELAAEARLVLTTGGTGFGPRDVTPEATRRVLEREATSLTVLMLTSALKTTPMAALSRGLAGTVGSTLIVNLPGSPLGASENLDALLPVLSHVLDLLSGDTEHRDP